MLQNITVKVWERIGGVMLFAMGWALLYRSFDPIGPPWNTLFLLGGPPLIFVGLYLFLRKKP